MQNQSEAFTPRREFLGQIAVSALALAGTACTTTAAATQTTPQPVPNRPPQAPTPPTHWDDSWSTRLTAKHKAVFDMPEVDEGSAIEHASLWIEGTREALAAAAADTQAVIVIRHAAVVLAFNDVMWAKYEIGKERKVKDPSTDKWAVRNPFGAPEHKSANDSTERTPNPDRPADNLAWFAQNGHILLACDIATRGMSSILARKTKGDRHTIYEELKANLIPGVILQPSGIYAVHRAQEAGCTYSS